MCDFKEVYIDFEKLGNTNRESEFMSEITNMSNELYHNLILLSGIRESEGLLSRKEAIICGLLLRAAKLFNSFMTLVVNRDSVGATFLYRGITDCIIDMEILIKRDDDELFEEFVRHSLYAEVKKIDTLEQRIENREPLPIEHRMLSGCERDIIRSGYTLEEARSFPSPKKNKWKNLKSPDKISELGYEDMSLFGQNTGNNFIHSNWTTLLYQHLEYHEGGKYSPNYANDIIRPQLPLTIQQLICDGAQAYITYVFSSKEVIECLSNIFSRALRKIVRIDELHEAFLNKKAAHDKK